MTTPASPPPPGRIDIHSHLLPGIDDGCREIEESIACVRMLQEAGYVGSVCTPHIWHELFPLNVPDNIRVWTDHLQADLRNAGLDYRVWPGGELRLFEGVTDWCRRHGVPTLGDSKCVLVDFWDFNWPRWINGVFVWLIERGYQPILAHPERIHCRKGLDERLRELEKMGVWLQGNFNSVTGAEGPEADDFIRQLLREDRFRLLALDMHRPDTLESRLDGVRMVAREFGPARLDLYTIEAPRQLILGSVQPQMDTEERG
jgi:protein-tyrosine phosphatase